MKTPKSSLEQWILSPGAAEYFGDSFTIKLAVLAAITTGGNMAEVARAHGVTKAATAKQARRARKLLGIL